MEIAEEKRVKDARRKILSQVFMTGCYSFIVGLEFAQAIRHPNDYYYSFIAIPAFLVMAIASRLIVRRDLGRFLAVRENTQTSQP